MSSRVKNDFLAEATQVGERVWLLPPWDTTWGRMVYPLLVVDRGRMLHPLGTGFRFSKLLHVLTARHNVEGALRTHHPDSAAYTRRGLEAARSRGELKHVFIGYLTQGPNPIVRQPTLEYRAFSAMHAALETDLLVGSSFFNESWAKVPYAAPQVSFAPPRIGEDVYCVGYTDMKVPDGGLSLEAIQQGKVNPYDQYEHRLQVVRGRVREIFARRLARGFCDGPCFSIDNEVPHGMSGGPIFRSDGTVCGVVYAGASGFFEGKTAIGSLLYPMFVLNLSFGLSIGGRFHLTASERPVAELVATQEVRTDGAEETQLAFTKEASGIRISPLFNVEDVGAVFEDFAAFQRREHIPDTQPGKLRGFRPNLAHPAVKQARREELED